jgi:hypothetical protein
MLNQFVIVGRLDHLNKRGEWLDLYLITKDYDGSENEVITITVKNKNISKNVEEYLQNGCIVGCKGKVINECGELCLLCEKVTFLSQV